MKPDLSEPIRTAIIGNSGIAGMLAQYAGEPAVFTRTPTPATDPVPYPQVVVSPDLSSTNEDGLTSQRFVISRDVAVYGRNDQADSYRNVETIAKLLQALFHRQKRSLQISGFRVFDLVATGPSPSPVDDDQNVGRVVTLTIRLQTA